MEAYPKTSIVSLNGRLSLDGIRLVNERGENVVLRGISTHGIAWNPKTYHEESIRTLVEQWGITLFRIAVYTHEWGGYCTGQWKSKEEYREVVDRLVDVCGGLGIYCIVDWHVLNEGSGDPNFTLEDSKEFWHHMSQRHQGKPHVLFEICNEPNGDDVTWEVVKSYAEEIIPIIRNIDPERLIICGTPTWSQDVDIAARNPLLYDNVIYSLHFYAGTHGVELRNRAEQAMKEGLPVMVSEFGLSRADGNGGVYKKECDTWLEWMEINKLSWVNWSFCDVDESSAALLPGAAEKGDWNCCSPSGVWLKSCLRRLNAIFISL